MQVFKFQYVSEEPAAEQLHLYPDYLISCLLRDGPGEIKAERYAKDSETVEIVRISRSSGKSETVGHLSPAFFRSFLAHFGFRCRDDMVYGGHSLFSCDFEKDGIARTHRFSIYLCNEPTMGVWLKLYLYHIDGVWPMPKPETTLR